MTRPGTSWPRFAAIGDPPAPRRDPQGGLPLLSHAPPAQAGRSPSFRLDAPGRTTPPEEQGGSGCFPPHARPSSQPGRSPRPAGNPRGPKRSAEAALHELFTFKPPSPIFGAQPPHSPRLWGRFGPPSSLSFPPGAGGRTEQQRPPGRAARASTLVPRSAAITSARAAPRLGSVSRATPSHPEQAAPGSRTRLTAGYTDATHRLPRQSAPEPLREPGTFA